MNKSVRFTGKFSSHQFELEENLNRDVDIIFKGKGELDGISEKYDNDSTKYINKIRVLNIIDMVEINTKKGKYIKKAKNKPTGRMSKAQELRMWIEDLWEAKGSEGEKEEFYQSYMDRLKTKVKAEVEMAKSY